MKQQIENIIKKNLPPNREIYHIDSENCVNPAGSNNYDHTEECNRITNENIGFNNVILNLDISLIADEVLKVMEKDKAIDYLLRIQGWAEQFEKDNSSVDIRWLNDILKEYFHLSPNKENENNG